MERELVGTIAIAVVVSMIAAPFFLSLKAEEPIRILKNEHPRALAVATSDSLGENAFEFGFVVNCDFARVEIGFSFLYGQNLTRWGHEKVDAAMDRIRTLQGMAMLPESQTTRTGVISYNGSEVNYTLWDFAPSPLMPEESNVSTFLILGDGEKVLACFTGVADLFPARSAGSLIEVTVTRSGDRTHFGRYASDTAGTLPIADLPPCPLPFDSVEKDETITVFFRSDARHAKPEGGGAVQVVTVNCDGTDEAVIFNFLE